MPTQRDIFRNIIRAWTQWQLMTRA
jgi:hypothetical protein